MLEKRIVFEFSGGELLKNEGVRGLFWEILNKQPTWREQIPELFFSVGSISKPVHFDFQLYLSHEDPLSKIHAIDDVNFISQALKTIKKYKEIDREVCISTYINSAVEDGKYIITLKNEPVFDIHVESKEGYWPKYMTFSSHENSFHKTFLKYMPVCSQNSHLDIELSVEDSNYEDIFMKMFEETVHFYERKHLKILEESNELPSECPFD